MNNPVVPAPPKEPVKEGIAAHNRRIGELINDLNGEIAALQRIEKALREAHDRLERHTSLMDMEAQLIGQLLKRERLTPVTKSMPIDAIADRVEEDLKQLAPSPSAAGWQNKSEPVAIPVLKR